MSEPVVIRGRPPLSTAIALLYAEGLPCSDLTDAHLEHFFFTGSDGSSMGLIGLELFGNDALLRSLVVSRSARNKGLGTALVLHAEDYASSKGARSIALLTTTAEAFFKTLGYAVIDRGRAPASIQRTSEFASLCPKSSTFMMKMLLSQAGDS